jgi:hypothetical protein
VGCVPPLPLGAVRPETIDALELPDVLRLELEWDASVNARRFGTRGVGVKGRLTYTGWAADAVVSMC